MRGVITGKDVIRHSLTIIRLFGPRCYLRCLRAALSPTPSTFLQVVHGLVSPSPHPALSPSEEERVWMVLPLPAGLRRQRARRRRSRRGSRLAHFLRAP